MASHSVARLTPEQYLDMERAAAERHEFVDGAMVAMAGGSPKHALITMNAGAALRTALRGRPCLTFSSDARVSAHWTRLITYPDVTVVCGQPEYAGEKRDTIANPTVLVEVLSPSTEEYDRGTKANFYRFIPSLREFLLVGQTPVEIDHYRRMDDGSWQIVALRSGDDVVQLQSLEVSIPVAEIYQGVELL